MLEDHILKTCGSEAASKICVSETPDANDSIGFAPEMQEGDSADGILSLRLASLEAMRAAGHTIRASMSTSFWPSEISGHPM